MDSLGVHLGFLEIQILVICAAFPLFLTIFTLFSLRRRQLKDTTLALWVLIICVAPYVGVFAYWMLRPWEVENRE